MIWERLELLSVASCRNVYSHIIDCKLVDCKKLNDFQTVCLLIFVFLLFFVQFGRTEVIDNTLNPDFVRKFILDYFFEERQNLRFDL